MDRLLTFAPRPLRGPSFTLAIGAAGYVMGLAFFRAFLPDLPDVPDRTIPAAAAVPGLLSAAVGWFASRASTPGRAAFRAFGAAVATSLICAPLTYAALAVLSERFGPDADAVALTLVFVTAYGALISTPLGVVFGVIFAAQAFALARLLQARAHAGRDAALGSVGLGWVAVAVLAGWSQLVLAFMEARPSLDAAWGLGILGLAVALAGSVPCALRRWLVRRARAGALPGWAVVPRGALEARELPRLFALGSTDHVLVRRAQPATGPFRDHETTEPIALV